MCVLGVVCCAALAVFVVIARHGDAAREQLQQIEFYFEGDPDHTRFGKALGKIVDGMSRVLLKHHNPGTHTTCPKIFFFCIHFFFMR